MSDTSNLDNLLDSTLDDLEDLPSYQPYPIGAHKVLATLEAKEINSKSAVELSFKYMEMLELANANDEVPKPSDEASTLYFLDNEFGRGNLKPVLAAFSEVAGSRNNREIIEAITEVECIIVTALSKNRNDPDKPYLDVKEIQVV